MTAPTTLALSRVDRARARLFDAVATGVRAGLPAPSVGISDDAQELRIVLPVGATGAVDAWAYRLGFPTPALAATVLRLETGESARPYGCEAGGWRNTVTAEIVCAVRFGPVETLAAGALEPGDQVCTAMSVRFADELPMCSVWSTVVAVTPNRLVPGALPLLVEFDHGDPMRYDPDEKLTARRARVGVQ